MKSTILNLLLVGTIAITSSCGNNDTDSKKIATDDNKTKEKVDSSSTVPANDSKFAVNVADDGMMEVQLAKLALMNSSSTKVKKFAQQMVDDHGKANSELKTLATAKNITLPDSISNKNKDKYIDMAKKKGSDFDKAYTSAMVGAHKDAIDAFTKEADKGTDPDLKSWAGGKLSTLEHHLMMAQANDSLINKQKM
ncbi:DUF4142 domain-containing protein [Parasediminibacterium sp. JCM 36343]|uniref:DUF4142 domain-containing protein n=1 Tax=Parasediminibacterium sp. JCM 36343 TaxID=3374279 RepID=UPI003979F8FF